MPTTLEQPAPSFADVWRMFQETDLKFKETDLRFKETDKAIKKVSANIDRLGNRLGEFVEEMVKPGLVRLFQARGLKVHRTMQKLLGAVAAMVLPVSVGRHAWRKGLFVLAQNGEIVEIRNDDCFEPRVW